jgi:hypothetical protein
MINFLYILLSIFFVAGLFYFIMFIYPEIQYKNLKINLDLIKKSITIKHNKIFIDVGNLNIKEVLFAINNIKINPIDINFKIIYK